MKKETAEEILNETEIGYDLMADKFSETRKYFWRDLEFIGNWAKDGDRILDFGCGNGRLLELLVGKNIKYQGVDVSEKLIALAKNKYSSENLEFSKINPSQNRLAFNDDYFNAVYSIAVFHHFPGQAYREKMAKELFRITEPGGYIIITTWNLWPASTREDGSLKRDRQKKYIKNIIKNWIDKLLGKSLSPHQFQNRLLNILSLGDLRLFLRTSILGKNWCGDELDWNDCYITFKDNQGNVFKRYHHAFIAKELEKLFLEAGFKKEKIISGKNLIFIGRKA
jgi:ubiquinone/menaquinone biosynthesis C-methylase UbiE